MYGPFDNPIDTVDIVGSVVKDIYDYLTGDKKK